MKAIELAKKLLNNPDFDVVFRDFDCENGDVLNVEDIDINDIGYSDKIIVLGGAKKLKDIFSEETVVTTDKPEVNDWKDRIFLRMLEHQPFGWLKKPAYNTYFQIIEITDDGICISENGHFWIQQLNDFSSCTFIDGTPFLEFLEEDNND